mmetsp:Transcript_17098/g.30857  ORF Transcript_17098/g.30857 Transcript_17098/m.30857 type:complete len:158 (+) Transcript_17098:72-545(+)
MGCGCCKGSAADDPQTKQALGDEALARRLQAEEDRRGGTSGTGPSTVGRQQDTWSQAGAGTKLGGSSGGGSDQDHEDRRQRALEAAEKRQMNQPGISPEKVKEMNEKRKKEELLGKLAEYYNRKKQEMPMGLNAATSEQLKKHWEMLQSSDPMATST